MVDNNIKLFKGIKEYKWELQSKEGKLKIITAKEAKKQSEIKALIKLAKRRKQQLVYIEKLIRHSVEQGEASVTYYGDIFDEVKEILLNAGYLITIEPDGDSNNLCRNKISWSDEDKTSIL